MTKEVKGEKMKHNPKLTSFAQTLRTNMTKEERKLWYEFLNTYPLRFRRQVTVGNYILDFYCAAARLAVELDGSQHFFEEGKAHDAARTAYLESMDIKVLRYSNSVVMKNFNGICIDIDRVIQARVLGSANK